MCRTCRFQEDLRSLVIDLGSIDCHEPDVIGPGLPNLAAGRRVGVSRSRLLTLIGHVFDHSLYPYMSTSTEASPDPPPTASAKTVSFVAGTS